MPGVHAAQMNMATALNKSELLNKFGEDCTNDVFCLYVCRDGSVLTGHDSRVNVWTGSQVDSECKWSVKNVIHTPVRGDVNSICEILSKEHSRLVISVNNTIVFYNQQNLALVHQVSFNKEEVNLLDINQKGNLVCSCDDSGEIKVIDTSTFQVVKTLYSHDNICSTVKFVPRKPWEIVSGGLDCKVIRWDFNRGRPLTILNQTDLPQETVGSYAINPPMVHSLDVFPSTSTVACGLGNGVIAVYALKSGRGMEQLCVSAFHSTSIGCVCINEVPKLGSKSVKQYIVSGGNDRQICVIQLIREEAHKEMTRGYQLKLISQWDNGSKINCLSVHSPETMSEDSLRIYVADQSCYISVYKCAL